MSKNDGKMNFLPCYFKKKLVKHKQVMRWMICDGRLTLYKKIELKYSIG